jgi:hypothetical protein
VPSGHEESAGFASEAPASPSGVLKVGGASDDGAGTGAAAALPRTGAAEKDRNSGAARCGSVHLSAEVRAKQLLQIIVSFVVFGVARLSNEKLQCAYMYLSGNEANFWKFRTAGRQRMDGPLASFVPKARPHGISRRQHHPKIISTTARSVTDVEA